MLKAEEARVQSSCWNRAHPNEPVFVLLGRDASAAVAIRAWILHRLRSGKSTETSPEIVQAREWCEVMERYARAKGKEKL